MHWALEVMRRATREVACSPQFGTDELGARAREKALGAAVRVANAPARIDAEHGVGEAIEDGRRQSCLLIEVLGHWLLAYSAAGLG